MAKPRTKSRTRRERQPSAPRAATTATALDTARVAVAAAEAEHATCTEELRDAAAAVEAAHAAIRQRKPDAPVLLQRRRLEHDAAQIRFDGAAAEVAKARAALAEAERADQQHRLGEAMLAAERAAVIAAMEPALKALAEVRRWQIVQPAPRQVSLHTIASQPVLELVPERPALDLAEVEHKAALATFVRHERKRAAAYRRIAEAIDAQAVALATARELAQALGVPLPGDGRLQPVTVQHAEALAALYHSPRPTPREWFYCWSRAFALDTYGYHHQHDVALDELARGMVELLDTGRAVSRLLPPAPHNWPAGAPPHATPGAPRAPDRIGAGSGRLKKELRI